jgi:hypothetical protein
MIHSTGQHSESHACEVRPRSDKARGRSDFRCAPLRPPVVGKPDAVKSAVEYANHRSRSHDAVIRIYDEAGNVIETHEHIGDFKE